MKKAFCLDKLCFSGAVTKYFWSSQAGKHKKKWDIGENLE